MLKKRGKAISLLITLVFLFTMILPGMAFGAGECDFTWSTANGVETDNTAGQDLGFVKITDIEVCDSVYVEMSLPTKVDFEDEPLQGTIGAYIYDAAGHAPAWVNSDVDEYVVFFDGQDEDVTDDGYIKLIFSGAADVIAANGAPDDIYASVTVRGVEDDIEVWAVTEECLIGVQGDAEITVEVDDPLSVNVGDEQEIAEITFSENLSDSFATDDEIVLTLPDGMKWDANWTIDNGSYGLSAGAVADGDELTITITGDSDIFADEFSITAEIVVFPNASEGDVEVDIASGEIFTPDFDDVTVVVGYVGASDGIINVEDTSDDSIYKGDVGIFVDEITIETTGGDFVGGDDIYLTLSPGSVWALVDEDNTPSSWNVLAGIGMLSDADLEWHSKFNGGRSMWLTVADGESYDEISFELPVITVSSMPPSPITVTMGGTYESAEPVIVGEIISQAEVTAEVTDASLFGLNQAAGDITIAETEKHSLLPRFNTNDASWFISLELPNGVSFTDEPEVYINGDEATVDFYGDYDWALTSSDEYADLAAVKTNADFGDGFAAGDNKLFIAFDKDEFRANKADTIIISDINYDFDTRCGNIDEVAVGIGGRMMNDLLDATSKSLQKMAADPVYTVVNAAVRGEGAAQAAFVIGATSYTINGVEYTLDAAPYISGDRTYLPIRYAAYALGISDADIIWDGESQTVTLMKGDKVVQLKVGSTELLINGAVVTMDVVPEITNDRVCLPIRFVAQSFAAAVGWDAETQTVSVTL